MEFGGYRWRQPKVLELVLFFMHICKFQRRIFMCLCIFIHKNIYTHTHACTYQLPFQPFFLVHRVFFFKKDRVRTMLAFSSSMHLRNMPTVY
jgi:hypothetical protein